jgi:aspartate racemase
MSAATLTVGVLGGMGPAATIDFMDKLIKATGAKREQDNLRLLVDCNPHVPDRNAAIADAGAMAGVHPGPVLADMARGLERAGADFVVMACNTAHAYEADIRAALGVPFVSLIAETAATLQAAYPTVRRVGLLAADGCLGAGLYQNAFAAQGVDCALLGPEPQSQLMDLIYAIKRGDRSDAARAQMRALADLLVEDGAQVVVAACTEVPLVLAQGDIAAALLDSTEVLVARTLAYAQRREPLPGV